MKEEFIGEIIEELSYRVLNGMPDLKNKDHLIVLRKILEEKGLSYDSIEIIMNNLRKENKLLTEDNLPVSQSVSNVSYIDYNIGKNNDDKKSDDTGEDEEGEEDSEEMKEESYISTYIFDVDKPGIVETGNRILKSDVIKESKYKCFMTNEVYLETKNGTLVKELDYLDSNNEKEGEEEGENKNEINKGE